MIRSGRLRHRIEIQSVTRERDKSGSTTDTWATDDTVWAEVRPMRGREYEHNQQIEGTVTHIITIRYYSGLTPKNRILWGSRIFTINFVKDFYEIHHVMEVLCTEVVT